MRLRGFLLVALGLVFFGWGYLITSRGSDLPQGKLKIEVAPSEANIRIDGSGAKNGEQSVDIGAHKVSITMPGFSSYEKTVNITQATDSYIGTILVSNSPDTKDWYENHANDQELTKAISDQTSDVQNAEIAHKYPIFVRLPVTFGNGAGGTTKINPENPIGNSNKPSIGIYAANPQQRQAALGWIYNRNYTISDLDVVFYGARIPIATEETE